MVLQIRKIAYKVIHSMTILLPDLLGELKMSIRNIPRDVATRWNSTFDMLDFALEYQKAIKLMVSDPDHGLSQYAMSAQEWKIVAQLRDVLKVSHNCDICFAGTRSSQRQQRMVREIATSSGASSILRRNSSSDVYHAFAQHLRHNATNG
jgi:hypothetical protein